MGKERLETARMFQELTGYEEEKDRPEDGGNNCKPCRR